MYRCVTHGAGACHSVDHGWRLEGHVSRSMVLVFGPTGPQCECGTDTWRSSGKSGGLKEDSVKVKTVTIYW